MQLQNRPIKARKILYNRALGVKQAPLTEDCYKGSPYCTGGACDLPAWPGRVQAYRTGRLVTNDNTVVADFDAGIAGKSLIDLNEVSIGAGFGAGPFWVGLPLNFTGSDVLNWLGRNKRLALVAGLIYLVARRKK